MALINGCDGLWLDDMLWKTSFGSSIDIRLYRLEDPKNT